MAVTTTVQDILDGQIAQVVANRYQAILESFDREVLSGDPNAARSTLDHALADPSLAHVAPELKILRSLLVQMTMLGMSGAEAIKSLPKRGGVVVLKLADGEEVSGTVFSVRDPQGSPTIVLHTEVNGNHLIRAVALDQVQPRTRMDLLHPAEPRPDDERLAKALIAMRYADLPMARSLLESVVAHPLKERYLAVLSRMEAAATPATEKPPQGE